jgi:hypothetical protein
LPERIAQPCRSFDMANIASVIWERTKKRVKIEPARWSVGGDHAKVIY